MRPSDPQTTRWPAHARTLAPEGEAASTSLEKGLVLLQELAASPGGSLTISALASAAGLNRTTAYRLVGALERAGWLQLAPDDSARRRRQVDLGPTGLGFAVLAMNKYDREARLQNVLDQLAHTVGETVHAAVLDGAIVIHVARALPSSGPHMAVPIGTRGPAHVSALGKALLATLPASEVIRRYPTEQLITPSLRSLSNRTQLLRDLESVAEHGYAVDDEESAPGIKCIAAPIFGHSGTAIFALSVTSLPIHFESARLDGVANAVVAAAGVATSAFGGTTPAGWAERGRSDARAKA